MEGKPEYVVDPNMRFSDIIVPTIDTVRAHFFLELLISNVKPVSLRIKLASRNSCMKSHPLNTVIYAHAHSLTTMHAHAHMHTCMCTHTHTHTHTHTPHIHMLVCMH